jgi:hypothetical protein
VKQRHLGIRVQDLAGGTQVLGVGSKEFKIKRYLEL